MTTDNGPFTPGWLPSPPDYRDYTLRARLPSVLLKASPPSVPSLTKAMAILDQGNLGSCTAYASGRAFRYLDRKDTVDFDVSELFQYWNSRFLMGPQYVDQDSGAYNRDAAKALATYGQAREELWRYEISRFREKPPQPSYEHAAGHKALEYISVPNDVETMKAVIAAGFPIVIGFTVYSNYTQGLSTGIWPEAAGRLRMVTRFNTNNFRLFLKGLITAWVPVATVFGVEWPSTTAAVLVMGASTFTIDGFFWMFGVGDGPPALSEVVN